jgi:hypothetical protein
MTSAISLSHSATQSTRANRDKGELSARELEEFNEMSEVMVKQKGLLNVIQAATYLKVSRERIYELMERKILDRYDFLGRVYLSFKQVQKRRRDDIQAGRPKGSLARRLAISIKAATQTDPIQAKHGGYAGPVYRRKGRGRK